MILGIAACIIGIAVLLGLTLRDVARARRREYHIPSGGAIAGYAVLIVLVLAACGWLYLGSDYAGDDPVDSDPATEAAR